MSMTVEVLQEHQMGSDFLSMRALRVLALAGLLLCVTLGGTGCALGSRRLQAELPDAPLMLQPGDTVHVEVFREPELSGSFRLTAEGVIRHPLLGDVALGGLAAAQAEAHLRDRLADNYLVNPRVILRVESSASMQVMVMGEVKRPGSIALEQGERLTLLEAISRAGGFTDAASVNRVRVVRTDNGRRRRIRVRVAKLLAGSNREENMILQPNDVVMIPEIWF